MQKKFTLIGTGTTDPIDIAPAKQLTFAAVGDAGDYTLTAEVQLTDKSNPNWFPAQVMTDNTIYATVTGARNVRFDLSALGTATTIDVEITGADL